MSVIKKMGVIHPLKEIIFKINIISFNDTIFRFAESLMTLMTPILLVGYAVRVAE